MPRPLTLVLDIGKSHAKLLFVDDGGEVVERHGRDNQAVSDPRGHLALDLDGLQAWVVRTLQASACTARCREAIATTHGAAFVALDEAGVAWAPLDYEFEPPGAIRFDAGEADFVDTLSPDLPGGLNAARQLAWMQATHPEAFARTRTLLPYPQYWAWWLSGVAASERSSLGCHTHLWCPSGDRYSRLAQARGWAARFAPMRQAREVLGPVQAARARETGLPEACQVHVGVHDSNACLARTLSRWPQALLLSTGTWAVLMAPGADPRHLDAARDMLGNVSAFGDVTPTARFMAGREHAALRAGAPPEAARLEVLERLLRDGACVLPAFSAQGGPFRGQPGSVSFQGQTLDLTAWGQLSEAARASLAALYVAQVTAWLVERLEGRPSTTDGRPRPLVVEGPMAHSPLGLRVLAGLLPGHAVHASTDPLEGTARGAWMLTRREAAPATGAGPELQPIEPLRSAALQAAHARWRKAVAQREAALAA